MYCSRPVYSEHQFGRHRRHVCQRKQWRQRQIRFWLRWNCGRTAGEISTGRGTPSNRSRTAKKRSRPLRWLDQKQRVPSGFRQYPRLRDRPT